MRTEHDRPSQVDGAYALGSTHKNESNALNMTRTSSGSSAFSSTPAHALSSGTISMWWPSSDSAILVGLEIDVGDVWMLPASDGGHGGVDGNVDREKVHLPD